MAKIPTKLEELLPVGAFEKVVDLLQRPDLSGRLREALGKVGIKEMNPLEQVQDAWQQAKTWLGSLTDHETHSSQQWINATGCLFSAQIDRAPMIPSVGLSWARNSSAFLDRAECLKRSNEVIDRAIGVQRYAWLSEPLAALQISTRALASSVVIARCDCVRIGGFGDVRSMLAAFGNSVMEVGAANGASQQDWTTALAANPQAAVVLTSPSGLPRDQWTGHRQNAIAAAKLHGTKVIEIIVDGSFDRRLCKALGFPHPIDWQAAGAYVALVPTHFMVGGARGMICLGDPDCVELIASAAALHNSELDSSGISANLLALQLATLEDEMDFGLVGALTLNPENLRNRCQRLAVQLQGVGPIQKAEMVESQHGLGPSPWDQYRLSNQVISLQTTQDPLAISEKLKKGSQESPSIEIRRTESTLSIDLRFVAPDDDHRIVTAIKAL